MNRQGDLLHESWQWEDDPEVDFYVKLMLPDGSIEEFKTRPEVHAAAGEGMRGTATVDGKWLGAFLPHIGAGGAPDRGDLSPPQVEVAYDPTDPRYRE